MKSRSLYKGFKNLEILNAGIKHILALFLIVRLLTGCTVGYKNDGKEVTWYSWDEGRGHHSKRVHADPQTFQELDYGYGKDKTYAFYEGNTIEMADGATFRVLKEWYAADKNNVYLSGELVEKADPLTFKVHSYYLTEDHTDFYWNGKPLNVKDKSSFILLGEADDWDTRWAKDQHNGYFLSGRTIPDIDYQSFHPIKVEKASRLSGFYAADKYRVFFMDCEIPDADPITFYEVDFQIGQDKNRVYKHAVPTQIKDYSKLTKVGRLMYSDSKRIYDTHFQILPKADVQSFEHIENNWYKDKNHVWWNDKVLEGADPMTFIPVPVSSYRNGRKEPTAGGDFNFGKDDSHVYFRDSIIAGADAYSFEKIDFKDASDWTIFDRYKVYQGVNSPNRKKYLKEVYGQ